jgi:tetratricopeptide (TPR) repeat protein
MSNEMTPLSAKFQQALALHQQGHLTRARTIYEKILKLQPRHFDALHLSGVIAAQTNNSARALTLIGKALEINPNSADAYCNQGSAFKVLEQFEAALRSYDNAIAIRPDYAEAHCCRSMVLRELGRWDEALASCDRAIAIRPNYADAFTSRGKIFKEMRQWDSAIASYDKAIALNPGIVEAHTEKGIGLRELGHLDGALVCYERALAIDGNYVHAHLNRGNVYMDLRRLDDALASFSRAVSLKPDFAEARANRSSIFLLRGDFANGWADYEWRWKVRNSSISRHKGNYLQPHWLGDKPIAGKTILLRAEQGFGDTLQFCRYATLVARLGAKVILQVPKSLAGLLTSLEGVLAVYCDGDPLPVFDFYCRMMSLPLAFRTTMATIPSQVPYLTTSDAKRRHWKEKIGQKCKPRVGLVWSGGFRPNQQEGWSVLNRRIMPLLKLASLKNPEIEFYSLQKGQLAESELVDLKSSGWDGPELIDFASSMQDFADTAALIEQLDLVISVDTSTAHLAGALGKPVWILLCFDSCWRWLAQRADSPWYPTARLYRQERPGNWDGVVERVRQDLGALVQSG